MTEYIKKLWSASSLFVVLVTVALVYGIVLVVAGHAFLGILLLLVGLALFGLLFSITKTEVVERKDDMLR